VCRKLPEEYAANCQKERISLKRLAKQRQFGLYKDHSFTGWLRLLLSLSAVKNKRLRRKLQNQTQSGDARDKTPEKNSATDRTACAVREETKISL
jgi:hypothetical protein